MKIIITSTLCVLSISGCVSGDKSTIKKAVMNKLKDPDSAKFGEFKYIPDFIKLGSLNYRGENYDKPTNLACLEVNSRNSMGGYVGRQWAYLEKTENAGWIVKDISFDNICYEPFMNY